MMKRLATLCLGLGLVGTMACVDGEIEDEPGELREAGLNISVDYDGAVDVVGFRYNISQVACPEDPEDFAPIPVVVDKDIGLKELTLPGGIPKFTNDPFAEGSSHIFADYFTLLEAGCYDVSVRAMSQLANDEEGKYSLDCPLTVTKSGVRVFDGLTTEILLVSQCDGPDIGALDIIAALNRPPRIVDFDYDPNKFVKCPPEGGDATVEVCATAKDPDGDPMNFYWYILDEDGEATLLELEPDVDVVGNYRTECVTLSVSVPESGGVTQEFRLEVYDKFVDFVKEDGEIILIHAEDWINREYYNNNPVVQSNHKLTFPVHVVCEDPVVDPPPPNGEVGECPASKGSWKNLDWPDLNGINEDTVLYERTDDMGNVVVSITWFDVLPPPPTGEQNNMCWMLGAEFVAASLNIADDRLPHPDDLAFIEATILAAGTFIDENCDEFIDANHPLYDEGDELREILEAFNDGDDYQRDECADD